MMDEREYIEEFVKEVVRRELGSARGKRPLNYGVLKEDDYLGANITNLDDDVEVVHRKTGYLYPGTGDLFAVCEMMARRLPPPVAERLVELLRWITQYNSAEEGRAITDLNTALSKRYSKYAPYMPMQEEEEEGGVF